jgi:hypothetical protein
VQELRINTGLPRLPESPFVCAVDSTKLLSADAFLLGAKSQDPEADSDFEFIVNHYCNDVGRFYVAPQTSKKQAHATALLALWQDTIVEERRKQGNMQITNATGGLEDLPFDSRAEDIVLSELAPAFSTWSRANYDKVVKFLEYQFKTDPLMDIFWEGKNRLAQLEKSLDYVRREITPEHPLFVKISDASLTADSRFRDSEPLSARREYIPLAYAFFGFAKGRLYHYRVPDGPMYEHHWLRKATAPEEGPAEVSRNVRRTILFPWGTLLASIYKTPGFSFGDDPERLERFASAVSGLRAYTKAENPLLQRYFANDGLENLLKFAEQGLRKHCDWIPTTKEREPLLTQATITLRRMLGLSLPTLIQLLEGKTLGTLDPSRTIVYSLISAFVLEQVPFAIPRRLLAQKSFDLHRKFCRRSLSKHYDLEMIRRPVIEFWKQIGGQQGPISD